MQENRCTLEKSHVDSLFAGYSEPLFGLRLDAPPVLYNTLLSLTKETLCFTVPPEVALLNYMYMTIREAVPLSRIFFLSKLSFVGVFSMYTSQEGSAKLLWAGRGARSARAHSAAKTN
jgi:hypothetical protein